MDAVPTELGIHDRSRAKSAGSSIDCHGCPESSKTGIHGGIHGGPESSGRGAKACNIGTGQPAVMQAGRDQRACNAEFAERG